MLPQIQYTKIHITFLDKFGPVFATEGQSATLTATMTLNPNLANLQPEAQWYRDGNYCKVAFFKQYVVPAASATGPKLVNMQANAEQRKHVDMSQTLLDC